MTCAHLKLLGPCFKTGQMGDRPDTECGTEQRATDNRSIRAQCMHRTRTLLLPIASHEFTNPLPTAKPIRHPADQVSSLNDLSSFRPSNGVLDRFGALCAQVHHLPTRKCMPTTLQNTEHTPRANLWLNTRRIRRLHPLPL
jgi:hypothetical protein